MVICLFCPGVITLYRAQMFEIRKRLSGNDTKAVQVKHLWAWSNSHVTDIATTVACCSSSLPLPLLSLFFTVLHLLFRSFPFLLSSLFSSSSLLSPYLCFSFHSCPFSLSLFPPSLPPSVYFSLDLNSGRLPGGRERGGDTLKCENTTRRIHWFQQKNKCCSHQS